MSHMSKRSQDSRSILSAGIFEGGEALIQVSLDLTTPKTRERELRALAGAAKQYPNASLILLTEYEESTETVDEFAVQMIPAWRWLTGTEK